MTTTAIASNGFEHRGRIWRAGVAAPIVVLALAGCTFVGSSTGDAPVDCPASEEVNELWQYYFAAAASDPFGNGPTMPDLDSGPFLLGDVTDIEPESLADALSGSCVYVGQSNADAMGLQDAVFIISDDVDVEEAMVEALDNPDWTNTDSEGDRVWEKSSCGGQVLEYTQLVQGKPELVGGYVETFSAGLHDLFPDAEYALMVNGMSGC